MDREEMMYYYYFIVERKTQEMEKMKETQDAKGGDKGNSVTVKCPPPDDAPSWKAWLKMHGEE